MTLNELIEMLEDYRNQLSDIYGSQMDDADVEVRVALQPSYPLAANVYNVSVQRGYETRNGKVPVVWIAASASVDHKENPYAPNAAWDGEVFGEDEEEDDDEA